VLNIDVDCAFRRYPGTGFVALYPAHCLAHAGHLRFVTKNPRGLMAANNDTVLVKVLIMIAPVDAAQNAAPRLPGRCLVRSLRVIAPNSRIEIARPMSILTRSRDCAKGKSRSGGKALAFRK
jgi:hypothetical protein